MRSRAPGDHQAVPRCRGQRGRGPLRRRRRGPRPPGRERRGQVHADERPLRPVPPDEGEILIDGAEVSTSRRRRTPSRPGIGMVHQHFMLVPVFTVAENVMLGDEDTRGLRTSWTSRRPAAEILESRERYGLAVDPDAVVEDLPVGVQQRVEILKALHRDARCLILDEPTAVLTPSEIDDLVRDHASAWRLRPVDRLHHPQAARGHAPGRPHHRAPARTGGRPTPTPAATDQQQLASLMVGHDVQLVVDKAPAHPGDPVLEVEDLVVADERDQVAVDGVTFRCARARSSPSPASRETARPSWSRPHRTGPAGPGHGPPGRRGRDRVAAQRTCSDAGRRPTCPRTGRPTAWSGRSTSPRTWSSTLRRSAVRHGGPPSTGPPCDERPSSLVEQFDVRTPSVDTRPHPVRRQPAEGHRRP